MLQILDWIKKLWGILNKIHPQTKSLIVILLFGYVLYSQIEGSTKEMIEGKFKEEILHNKKAEKYSMETSAEINNLVLLILEKDKDAFDVLLLSYHNNTQSLQGYKYLYLSCLTEAPRYIDTPLLGKLWNKIDYIYYADELSKIHSQGFVYVESIEALKPIFPKLYRLIKACEAEAVSFFTIEGHDSQIGMIVILYKGPKENRYNYHRSIIPHILKLAILLDYENIMK